MIKKISFIVLPLLLTGCFTQPEPAPVKKQIPPFVDKKLSIQPIYPEIQLKKVPKQIEQEIKLERVPKNVTFENNSTLPNNLNQPILNTINNEENTINNEEISSQVVFDNQLIEQSEDKISNKYNIPPILFNDMPVENWAVYELSSTKTINSFSYHNGEGIITLREGFDLHLIKWQNADKSYYGTMVQNKNKQGKITTYYTFSLPEQTERLSLKLYSVKQGTKYAIIQPE
jgi:hypothetical protein